MKNFSIKRSPHAKDGQALTSKWMVRIILVLVALGAMMFTVLGCGSNSTPGESVGGKNAKSSKSPGEKGKLAKGNDSQRLLLTPGVVREEPADKRAAPRKTADSVLREAFPGSGITQEQLEAKIAAERKEVNPNSREAFPGSGITQEQLEAKIAAERKAVTPNSREAFPGSGITQEQLKAKLAAERKAVNPTSREAFPGSGITQEQLEAKLAAERETAERTPFDPKLLDKFPGAGKKTQQQPPK